MALNGNQWGDELYAAFGIGSNPDLSASEKAEILNELRTLANTDTAHIIANAVVNTILNVTSVTGVIAGGATSGPGTGTGAGSIT